MSLAARVLLKCVRVYQLFFSSLMGRSCRFYPTCSAYTAESIRRFGALRGGIMGAKRICRCHPYNLGGYDPVPQKECDKKSACSDSESVQSCGTSEQKEA